MNYQPTHLDKKPILMPEQKQQLVAWQTQLTADHLLKNYRNLEEIGIDFIYSSAKLEGNTYDQFDTLALLKMGQTAGGKLYSDAIMLMNLREAFLALVNVLDNANDVHLKALIKDQHTLIADKLVPNFERGVVRNATVTIGGTAYQPLSSPQKLEDELNYLLSVYQNYDHPIEQAIYLHNNLAYLQYFIDGNKRTARNILTYVMMKANFFPIIFHLSDVRDYAKSIIHYYETGDYSVFVDYFLFTYQKTIEYYRPKPDVDFSR